MIVRCPQCEFSRTISEHKIPSTAEVATCPKCKYRFRFRTLDPSERLEAEAAKPAPSSAGQGNGRQAPPKDRDTDQEKAFPKEGQPSVDIWEAMDTLHQRWEAQLDTPVAAVESPGEQKSLPEEPPAGQAKAPEEQPQSQAVEPGRTLAVADSASSASSDEDGSSGLAARHLPAEERKTEVKSRFSLAVLFGLKRAPNKETPQENVPPPPVDMPSTAPPPLPVEDAERPGTEPEAKEPQPEVKAAPEEIPKGFRLASQPLEKEESLPAVKNEAPEVSEEKTVEVVAAEEPKGMDAFLPPLLTMTKEEAPGRVFPPTERKEKEPAALSEEISEAPPEGPKEEEPKETELPLAFQPDPAPAPVFPYGQDNAVAPDERVERDLLMLKGSAQRPSRDLGRIEDVILPKDMPRGLGLASSEDEEIEVPWEDPARHGWGKGFTRTVNAVLFNAPRFFAGLGTSETMTPGYLFFLAQGYLAIIFSLAWGHAAAILMGQAAGAEGSSYMLPVLLLLAPFALGLAQVFLAGSIRLATQAAAPEQAQFVRIFRLVGYASAPLIVSVIPFIGPVIGVVWFLACLVLGSRFALKLSWPLALLAPLPPALLMIGVVFLYFR